MWLFTIFQNRVDNSPVIILLENIYHEMETYIHCRLGTQTEERILLFGCHKPHYWLLVSNFTTTTLHTACHTHLPSEDPCRWIPEWMAISRFYYPVQKSSISHAYLIMPIFPPIFTGLFHHLQTMLIWQKQVFGPDVVRWRIYHALRLFTSYSYLLLPSFYLNHWWLISMTHICATRPQSSNVLTGLCT